MAKVVIPVGFDRKVLRASLRQSVQGSGVMASFARIFRKELTAAGLIKPDHEQPVAAPAANDPWTR